jgi:outer membrane protein OmpA-like peptidoglycan-associated protein
MNRSGLASLTLLTSLFSLGTALAQDVPPPPPPPPPSPAPTSAPAAEPAPPPAPTTPPPAAPPAAGAEAGASASGSAELGLGTSAAASAEGEGASEDGEAAADDGEDPNAERSYRLRSLHEQNSLNGSTGLMRVVQASSGAPGTFRFSMLASYFGQTGFLCNSTTPCPVSVDGASSATVEESTDRVGLHIGLSASLFSFLEASFSLRNTATSNTRSRPQLLQVLGDSSFALKGFIPVAPDQIFQAGGQFELMFLNGSGGVGPAGGATSFALRGLASLALDNRTNPEDQIPLRFHTNLGWLFDNSAAIVEDIEATPPPDGRGEAITRSERFGLDINRVDSFQIALGGEFVHPIVRPFLEWTIDVPVNRQKYTCDENVAEEHGDLCLAKAQRMSTAPSRFTLGARVFPWPEQGLSLLAAVDIGTGATSEFIDEVAPEPPYNLWFGLAWAVDTVPPAPIIQKVAAPVAPAPKPTPFVLGTVVDKASGQAVPGATVRFEGRALSGFVTAEDGSFRTFTLDPGTYTFAISAKAYKDGSCVVTVPSGNEPAQPPPAAPANPLDPPPPAQLGRDGEVALRCELEALPQLGNVAGSLVDAENQQPVGGARVKIRDGRGRELDLAADASGTFRFQNVPPGRITLVIDAPGYFASTNEFVIKALEDTPARIQLNKRPATPNVVVTGRELKLKKQVHFQHDSAEILPDSAAILEEIADVLKNNQQIKGIEVQGHTDNQGAAPYNLKLSESRAQAVVDTLVKLGVDPLRLEAKGYGDTKPLAPNTVEVGRAKNRRVQLMIKTQ